MVAADAILNLIALLGVFIAFLSGLRGNKSALDDKLSALYGTLSLFLAARQAFYYFNYPLLVIVIMAAGAWLPLIILLVAEEVLRRHAPYALKFMLLGGAGVFSICAILSGAEWSLLWLWLFAAYTALSIFGVTLFLLLNRKNHNAPFETQMADSFALALIICAIAIISEFRGLFPDLPVTFGTLGILVFVLTTFSLASENGSPQKMGIDLLSLCLSATFIIAAIWVGNHAIAPASMVQIWAFAFAINAVLLGLYRNIGAKLRTRAGGNFIESLSVIGDNYGLDNLIAAHPLTAAGNLISAKELQLYGDEIIGQFVQHRVLSRETFNDPKAAQALGNLLDENGANYLLRLGANPPKFLTIASGTIGYSKRLEAELRIFTHIAERINNVANN